MSATTPDESVVLTIPVVLGHETAKTVRFYQADAKGKPDKKGASIWLFRSMVEHLGVENAADLTVTITAVKTKPGVLVDGKTAAEIEKAAKAEAKAKAAAEKAKPAEGSGDDA